MKTCIRGSLREKKEEVTVSFGGGGKMRDYKVANPRNGPTGKRGMGTCKKTLVHEHACGGGRKMQKRARRECDTAFQAGWTYQQGGGRELGGTGKRFRQLGQRRGGKQKLLLKVLASENRNLRYAGRKGNCDTRRRKDSIHVGMGEMIQEKEWVKRNRPVGRILMSQNFKG